MSKFDTSKFKGIIVALNAAYDSNDNINCENVKRLVNWYIEKGVKGLYVCGSTGEGCLLSVEERKSMFEAASEAGKGKITLIVHVGAAATRDSIELAKHAEAFGADAISAVPSIYYRHSEAAIENHWNEIIKAADLPFFIYNIPQLTGYNLSDKLAVKMSKNDRVAGVKNSAEISHQIMHIKEICGEDFLVLNGPDEQYLAGRIMGADGGIGGTYGPMPELYMKLELLFSAGEIVKAQNLQAVILGFIERLCDFPSMYGANKMVIKLRSGINLGQPRLPFLPVFEQDQKVIELAADIEAAVAKWAKH